MAELLSFRLMEKQLAAQSVTLEIGYDRENVDTGRYHGPTKLDPYGRTLPKPAHGTARFDAPTNLGSQIIGSCVKLFAQIADPL